MKTLIVLLFLASSAIAGPIISIDNYTVLNTQQEIIIPIMVSSEERITTVNLYVQVGDGGAINYGTDTHPIITSLDIISSGAIFSDDNIGEYPFIYGQIAVSSTGISEYSLSANGILGFLTLDLSNTPNGSYLIKTHDVGVNICPPIIFNSDFADPTIIPSYIDGLLTIIGPHIMTWQNDEWCGDSPLILDEWANVYILDDLTINTLNVNSLTIENTILTVGSIKCGTLVNSASCSSVTEPSFWALILPFFLQTFFWLKNKIGRGIL